jgi:hypothetical protein
MRRLPGPRLSMWRVSASNIWIGAGVVSLSSLCPVGVRHRTYSVIWRLSELLGSVCWD